MSQKSKNAKDAKEQEGASEVGVRQETGSGRGLVGGRRGRLPRLPGGDESDAERVRPLRLRGVQPKNGGKRGEAMPPLQVLPSLHRIQARFQHFDRDGRGA